MNRPSKVYAASMAALIIAGLALGASDLEMLLGGVIGPVSVGAVAWSVRKNRPSRPGIWYTICAVGGLFMVGGLAHIVTDSDPYPTVADLIDLVGYAVGVSTIAMVAARRMRRGARNSITEILILPGALAVVLWYYVVSPGLRNEELSAAARSLNSTFNALSLVMCGLLAAILFAPGRQPRPIKLLMVMGLAVMTSDVAYSMLVAGTTFPGQDRLAIGCSAAAFALAGQAALDTEMVRVTQPNIESVGTVGRYRLLSMGVAAFSAPLVFALNIHSSAPAWVPVGAIVIWTLTLIGILARLGGLLRFRERQADANRVLTVAAEQFMAATSPPTMYNAAIRAAGSIIAGDHGHIRTSIFSHEDGQFSIVASTGLVSGELVGKPVTFLPEHGPVVEALEYRSIESFRDLPALDHVSEVAPVLTLFPLIAGGNLRGAVLVTTDRGLDSLATTTISSLATELSLALEGAAQAEAIHREASERRFRALVDESNDVIALLDDHSNLDFIGPAVSRLLGHSETDLIGTPIDNLVVPDDRSRFRACIEGHPSAPVSTEVRLLDATGRERWFDIIAADHRHDPNINGMVVTARDIHGRKLADDRTQRSEARFRSLVQHATDLVAVLGSDGTITYASPSSVRILGFEPDELVGSLFADIVKDRHKSRLRDSMVRLGQRPDVPYEFELELVSASNETRTLDITARDLRHDPTVEGVVVNARDVTDRKRLEQNLRHQALHDSLTGIPNRTLFHDRVEQALARRGADVAVFVIDIDDFKTVNDGLGHHTGDELLKVLAFRLRQVLRVGDTAARLGGDEFAVLIEDAGKRSQVVQVANRILDKFREPFEVGGHELSIEGSVGIAFGDDLTHRSADVLIRSADAAMYAAKTLGKGRVELYQESMHLGAMERLNLKTDLAKALERDEFELWYQPVVALADGALLGFEALIRWQRRDLGLMNPQDFIPIIEESGLIVPIGEWVLGEASRQLATWRIALNRPELTMGINVSPRQLQDEMLVEAIEKALSAADVPAACIAIELTETSRVDEDSIEADRLEAIGRLGCDVYADDFGAGYASYAALRRLPFSGVKLDRSLIDGVAHEGATSARAQVRSMIEMARHLDLSIVAEGIETKEQADVLVELGCSVGQGYYFGRPSIDGGLARRAQEVAT